MFFLDDCHRFGLHVVGNTSFVERQNGTERGQNSPKARKTYCFSKDWDLHNAASYFIGFRCNFRPPDLTH
jgi:hypothetical protein